MKKLNILALSVALALGLSATGCSKAPQETASSEQPQAQKATAEQSYSSGIYLENMDTSVRPGNDFFRYVNGSWYDKTEIPADKASYGGFGILRDEAQEKVLEIINASAEGDFAQGTDEQKVGDLYNSYMDMEKRNALGVTPLAGELAVIDAIESQQDLARYFARASKYGFGAPFVIGQYVDFKNPETYMIYSWQAGLGLPDREYYFKADEASQEIRNKYLAHIAKMFELTGLGDGEANANTIMALETRLADHHMKKEETRNMVALYNKVMLPELTTVMPDFPWNVFFEEAQLSNLDGLVVTQMDYMQQLNDIIQQTPMADWKTFLKWGLVNATASRLNEEIDAQNFEFYSKTLYGVEEPRPLWRRGVSLLNDHVGEIIGKVYVKQHFPPEAKARMEKLVENLLLAYEDSIKNLTWMTEDTKKEALDKLSKFTPKIGYPDKWRDYSLLKVDANDLYGNLMRSSEAQYQQMLEKQSGPVQKHEWAMTPQTVNAYYNPPMNEIVFPAAILQPPFFNMEAEDAVNYGGIGAVIGHEIGHGFDDSGSTFDGDGVLRNWWTDVDKQEFENRTAQLIEQYNQFEALPGVFVNGEFTLGENIGDLGGISIALKAYQLSLDGKEAPVMDGFTGEQRVFLGFGQVWANKYRDEALRNQIDTDPHSPSHFRANGAVRNVPEFYQAFDISPEDALYLAPEDRVKIW
ncbi:M13 family metallopeptidase [Planctobacterium marinum]|uniref:M13 family metallopeptidase n=1 Tax=Planctobacterium marinum TaxID=1631968 RepID=UPI001E5CF0BC|nr:M13-type metalloendopeptidase [Planctobacterium marinum]MCC2605416.1 peptidase M13 [Planctobacterium marinum]